jgi:molybdenum cofactor cytidylyltransferase
MAANPTKMPEIAAIILAAGQASRYRAADTSIASKVVAQLDGKALVRHVADSALASQVRPVIVVTGHARDAVELALQGLDVRCVGNEDYATGMASSLKRGVAALPQEAEAAIILLADMPRIGSGLIDRICKAFAASPGVDAVVPLYGGQRGNPVLLSRRLFDEIARLNGDEGARKLLKDPALEIVEFEAGEDVMLDIDTPEALAQASKRKP